MKNQRARGSRIPEHLLSIIWIAGIFIVFLGTTPFHRVHHISEQLNSLLAHQGTSPSKHHHDGPHQESDQHPASTPSKGSCQLQQAGQNSIAHLAELTPLAESPQTLSSAILVTFSPTLLSLSYFFSIRAPPFFNV